MKFNKLFVTGALGRVGARILPSLSQRISLKLTDRFEGKVAGENGEELPVEAVDLTDFAALCEAVKGCDAILHLAIASERDFLKQYPGQPERKTIDITPEEQAAFERAVLDVNMTGTYNLYEAARLAGVKRVIFMSSITIVLGHARKVEDMAFEKALPPKAVNFYAVTKHFGEELGELYHRLYGLDVLVLRLGQPYPVGTYHDNDYLASPLRRMVNTHLDDITNMVECALTCDLKYGVANLTSAGEPYTFSQDCWEEIGYRPKVRFTEAGMIAND